VPLNYIGVHEAVAVTVCVCIPDRSERSSSIARSFLEAMPAVSCNISICHGYLEMTPGYLTWQLVRFARFKTAVPHCFSSLLQGVFTISFFDIACGGGSPLISYDTFTANAIFFKNLFTLHD
jgi:hypothetical protein